MARLREERQQNHEVKQEKENGIHTDDEKEEIDLLCDEQMIQDAVQDRDSKAVSLLHTPERAPVQPSKPLRDQETPSDSSHRHPAASELLKDHHQQAGCVKYLFLLCKYILMNFSFLHVINITKALILLPAS